MDDPAFDTSSVDETTQLILLHSSNHDVPALKPLLRTPGNASVQDPETGFTPLHAAIAACGPPKSASNDISQEPNNGTIAGEEEEEEEIDLEKAKETVKELFLSGAIWNDLDTNNETPGCLAWRLGQKEFYDLVVDAGVRAEMLLGLLGGYEPLAGSDFEDEEEEEEEEDMEGIQDEEEVTIENGTEPANGTHTSEEGEKKDVKSKDYLKSELKFEDDKLLDADANGVMMAWETDIMRQTVDLLVPANMPGKRILNIGFGMGIIDRMFRDTKPASHHIIEAHPAVLGKLAEVDSEFGNNWEGTAPEGGNYVVHKGRWQDIVPKLLEEGEVFDVIYFDTFGEDYRQLKLFFSEYVLGLLDPEGRFGFFNGLGADRRVCYDVYCKVVELDLCDAGFDIEWADVQVDVSDEGQGEWKGVRRRYWTLDRYRLPVCTFLG
jgi:protein arginine N-methyltransferase 2